MRTESTAIVGARALLGEGLAVIDDAVVVIEGGRIAAAGPRAELAIPPAAAEVDAGGMTVLPGFIDAHVHIGFYDPRAVLVGGVTTVRDLGWPPDVIFDLVERSATDREIPRILAAGPMLTAPGGYPTRAAWAPPGTGWEIASPDDARPAVEELVAHGAAVIKIALHPDVGPTLDRVTLTAIVDAAHEGGLKVTGHVTGLAEFDKALVAGVDELAHMLMSPDHIPDDMLARMVAAEMTIVPTLAIRGGSDRALAIDNLARFVRAGGRVVYGTDLGNEGPRPGIDPLEVAAMTEAGLDGRAVVASATVDSARHLGLSNIGFIAPGMEADVVVVRGDPLVEPAALSVVAMVWRAGLRIR